MLLDVPEDRRAFIRWHVLRQNPGASLAPEEIRVRAARCEMRMKDGLHDGLQAHPALYQLVASRDLTSPRLRLGIQTSGRNPAA